MGYRSSTLYSLAYVAQMLGADEDLLHEFSIGMFVEDGCFGVYTEYPATERSEAITVFNDQCIENLQDQLDDHRANRAK
jgi:hypothetical protein